MLGKDWRLAVAVQKDPHVFVDLSLSRRPDFFEQVAALHPGALAPFERAWP